MNTLIETVVSNAVAATLVALGVAIATRFIRRPEVAYWLWLLVLVKLVTPPIVHIPLPLAQASGLALYDECAEEATEVTNGGDAQAVADAGLAAGADVSMTRTRMQESPPKRGVFYDESLPADAFDQPPEHADAVPNAIDMASREHRALAAPITPRIYWTAGLVSLWLAGSVFWFALATFRVISFGRLVRRAAPAPEYLQAAARQLASRFGLRRCPEVHVVATRVPPLLWKTGRRALIVLPSDLVDQLGRTEQTALVAHELAHYRRADHLIRWTEATILGLYWWHPVVWWARRRLHQAEEQCCDAWVLWALPGEAKRYAHALVTAVDFLSGARAVLPATTSNMEQIGTLRRRLEMILSRSLRRRMSWFGIVVVLMAAVLVLPWAARTVPAQGSIQAPEAVLVANALVLSEPTEAEADDPEESQAVSAGAPEASVEDGKLVVRGRVLLPDGSPAAQAKVAVRGNQEELRNVATASDQGEFELHGVFGNGLKLHAMSADRQFQGTRMVASVDARLIAAEPIHLRLAPSVTHCVSVMADDVPAEGVHVLASGWGYDISAQTNAEGKVELLLPAQGPMRDIAAWHPILGVGGILDLEDDPAKGTTLISLHAPAEHVVQVLDDRGGPVPDLELEVSFRTEDGDWMVTGRIKEANVRTDDKGIARVPWAPQHKLEYVQAEPVGGEWML